MTSPISVPAAAVLIDDKQSASIVATAANSVYRSATFAAGDLAVGDRIVIRSWLRAGGTGANTRTVAISVSTPGAGRQGCGLRSTTAASTNLSVESELVIQNDTTILFRTTIGGVDGTPSSVNVGSLAANPLTVSLEAWVGNASDPIVPYGCRIIPMKLGMRHLDVR